MVSKVFALVYKEVRGLHQAAYVLGFFALGSQILAVVRDRLLAHQFGAGAELDIYYAAFRIPDVLYVLFASVLSVYVLIPFVSARLQHGGGEARAFLSSVLTSFLLVYSFVALVCFVLAPYIVPLLFPGIVDERETLTTLSRILLLQPLLLGISSLFGVITQLGHRFVLYAVSPLLYNLGIIFGIAFLYPQFGLLGLGYGVLLGACAHVLVQVPFVYRGALPVLVTRHIAWGEIFSVLSISFPRALTLSLTQVVLLLLLGYASTMTEGSVSVFQFAFNLQSVPLAVIGASYSIAAFPYLADLFAQNKMKEFSFHIITALRHIIFWSIPAVGLIIVLRAHVVRVILGSGDFTWQDTRLTAAVFAIFSLSLVAQAAYLLLVRSFYAAGKTRAPLIITVIGSVCTLVCTYILFGIYSQGGVFMGTLLGAMRVSDVVGAEILVIAVAYSFGMWVQTILLCVSAERAFEVPILSLIPYLLRAAAASFVGALGAYATLNFFVGGINDASTLGIFIQGFFGGVMGIIGIVLTYMALRSPELTEIYNSFHSKVFKTDIVAPQEDIL